MKLNVEDFWGIKGTIKKFNVGDIVEVRTTENRDYIGDCYTTATDFVEEVFGEWVEHYKNGHHITEGTYKVVGLVNGSKFNSYTYRNPQSTVYLLQSDTNRVYLVGNEYNELRLIKRKGL